MSLEGFWGEPIGHGGGFFDGFGLVMKQLTLGGVALACYHCLLAANVCL